MLGTGARAIRVNLGGGGVACAGDAGTQAKAFEWIADQAQCHHVGADDGAICISGRDVGHFGNCFDDCVLERRLRILGVVNQIEPVWNGAGREWISIARSQCGTELGFIRVRGFVQVDVDDELAAQWIDQIPQRSRLSGGTVRVERAVRVDGVRVPALDALKRPR